MPLAVTLKVADVPAGTLWPAGWTEIEGGRPKVTVATLLVVEPKGLETTTV